MRPHPIMLLLVTMLAGLGCTPQPPDRDALLQEIRHPSRSAGTGV